jgi:hypothetical protein
MRRVVAAVTVALTARAGAGTALEALDKAAYRFGPASLAWTTMWPKVASRANVVAAPPASQAFSTRPGMKFLFIDDTSDRDVRTRTRHSA